MSAVRRLARCIYEDRVLCVCGELLPVRIMAVVGQRVADVYTAALTCKRCSASWGVQLWPRGLPHVRIQRLDRQVAR